MTENATDTGLSQKNGQENSAQPRKEWKLALIGLPDSGKSTFLARLYGSNIGDGKEAGRARFLLSFPSAIAMKEEEREVLEAIHRLWLWICSNFDKKHKTFDRADLTFNITGPGLDAGLAVHTKDLPGETFEALPQVAETVINPEALKEIKREMSARYPKCNAALMLIGCDQLDKAEHSALINSMLSDLPRRTRFGMPVFKLIVFSKAGTCSDPDKLRKRLAEIEATWRSQGFKWVKVIACEALNDLVKTGQNGDIQWSLPPAGTKPPFPKWIHTPSTAILELPRMYVSYRRWRNVKLAATAAALLAIMAGAWVYQGHRKDKDAYEKAVSQPEDRRTEAIEAYLANRSALRDNWFYPVKHRAEAAGEQWNKLIFARIAKTSDLERARNELTRVKAESLWKYVDRDKHREYEIDIESRIAVEKQRHAQEMNEWKAAAYNENHPERYIRDRRFDYSLVPSLANETENIRAELLSLYAMESKEIEAFRDLFANWRLTIPEVKKRLNRLTTETHLQYRRLQENRRSVLRQLSEEIENIGVEHAPYESNSLLELLNAAVAKQFDATAVKEIHARISEIQNRTRDRINDLERLSADRFRDFERATDWEDKVRIANDATSSLLDLPTAEAWHTRAQEWSQRLQESERRFTELQSTVRKMKNDPRGQQDLWRAFASESNIGLHSPKHRESARAQEVSISDEFAKYTAAWENVIEMWSRFERDKSQAPDMRRSMDTYKNLLAANDRGILVEHNDDYVRFDSEITNQNDLVAKLLADYGQAVTSLTSATVPADRTGFRRQLQGIILSLRTTHEERVNAERINLLFANIRFSINHTLDHSGISDDVFREALYSAEIAWNFAQALGREAETDEFSQKQTAIQTKWADDRWNAVKRVAEQHAIQGRYKDAITQLLEYKNATNLLFNVWPDAADEEIHKHQDAWQKQLRRFFAETPNISQRPDFDQRQARLRADFDEFSSKMGDAASVDLREAFTGSLEALNQALHVWYIARINRKLNELPMNKGRRIITTWGQLNELSKLFDEMHNDPVMRDNFRGITERAGNHYRELQSALKDRDIRIKIKEFKLVMPTDGDYWGDKFPQPKIRLMHNDNALWHVHIEDRKSNQAIDSRRQITHYKVGRDQGKFALESVNWGGLNDMRLTYKKGERLFVDIQVARQVSPPRMRLPLIESDQTPGVLLDGSIRTLRTEVECDPRVYGKKFTMLLELELSLEANDDPLNVFTLPEKFD